MPRPGEIVVVNFVGVRETKKRPALVISTDLYHSLGHDVVLAVLTSNVASATRPIDYVLQDWKNAGLFQPSAFRPYLKTDQLSSILYSVGFLSGRDWKEVQARLRLALAV